MFEGLVFKSRHCFHKDCLCATLKRNSLIWSSEDVDGEHWTVRRMKCPVKVLMKYLVNDGQNEMRPRRVRHYCFSSHPPPLQLSNWPTTN